MFYKCFTASIKGVKHVKQRCKTSVSKYNKEHTRMYVRTTYFNMITTKIIFDRRKVADRNTQGSVEIRITENRKSYWIATGVRVLRQEWAAGQVVNRQDAPELNKRLAVVYQKVCDEVNRYMDSCTAIDIEKVRNKV